MQRGFSLCDREASGSQRSSTLRVIFYTLTLSSFVPGFLDLVLPDSSPKHPKPAEFPQGSGAWGEAVEK